MTHFHSILSPFANFTQFYTTVLNIQCGNATTHLDNRPLEFRHEAYSLSCHTNMKAVFPCLSSPVDSYSCWTVLLAGECHRNETMWSCCCCCRHRPRVATHSLCHWLVCVCVCVTVKEAHASWTVCACWGVCACMHVQGVFEWKGWFPHRPSVPGRGRTLCLYRSQAVSSRDLPLPPQQTPGSVSWLPIWNVCCLLFLYSSGICVGSEGRHAWHKK